MKKLIFALAVASFLTTSCSQSADQTSDSGQASSQPAIVDQDIKSAYQHYVSLKDVLVKSDPTSAQSAAKDLAGALSKIEGCENTAELADQIASTDNLSDQREAFTALSSDLIALMKHTEIESGTVYVQHCPMANDGEGGYWLSSQEEIRNPYYGDEMLECGSVTETIRAK